MILVGENLLKMFFLNKQSLDSNQWVENENHSTTYRFTKAHDSIIGSIAVAGELFGFKVCDSEFVLAKRKTRSGDIVFNENSLNFT